MSRDAPGGLTRRAWLAAASAAAAGVILPARVRAQEPRVAVIDWAMLETVLALGVVPVAASELVQFRRTAAYPDVPASVVDLGLRGETNFELLRLVAPDLVVISSFYEYQRGNLERIAPVFSRPIYRPGTPPYPLAEAAARDLGARLGRPQAAARLIADTAAEIALWSGRLRRAASRPVFVVSLGDARHVRVFGPDSLFGDVLTRVGLANAWSVDTSYSAAAPVGIEGLARVAGASLIVVPPVPPDAPRTLSDSAIWGALPAARAGRVAILEPVNHFGALPAAGRFARLIGAALSAMDPV